MKVQIGDYLVREGYDEWIVEVCSYSGLEGNVWQTITPSIKGFSERYVKHSQEGYEAIHIKHQDMTPGTLAIYLGETK